MRITTIAVIAATAGLTACMGAPAGGLGPAPLTPTSRFSLQVEPGMERIALAVHDQGLSANQQLALTDFANQFGLAGAPVIRIEAPSGQDAIANQMAWSVRGQLESIGVPSNRIQVMAYDAPDPRAPVLVGFDTVQAFVPRCNAGATNLTRTAANATPANFGCAVTANLAAQIADPRDIVSPREMTPADAGRRAVVFDSYRRGQLTAAPRERLVRNQQISQAVQ